MWKTSAAPSRRIYPRVLRKYHLQPGTAILSKLHWESATPAAQQRISHICTLSTAPGAFQKFAKLRYAKKAIPHKIATRNLAKNNSNKIANAYTVKLARANTRRRPQQHNTPLFSRINKRSASWTVHGAEIDEALSRPCSCACANTGAENESHPTPAVAFLSAAVRAVGANCMQFRLHAVAGAALQSEINGPLRLNRVVSRWCSYACIAKSNVIYGIVAWKLVWNPNWKDFFLRNDLQTNDWEMHQDWCIEQLFDWSFSCMNVANLGQFQYIMYAGLGSGLLALPFKFKKLFALIILVSWHLHHGHYLNGHDIKCIRVY